MFTKKINHRNKGSYFKIYKKLHLLVDLFGISFKARVESFGKDVTVPLKFLLIYFGIYKFIFRVVDEKRPFS